jgi:hypothetical protein
MLTPAAPARLTSPQPAAGRAGAVGQGAPAPTSAVMSAFQIAAGRVAVPAERCPVPGTD